MNLLMLSGDTAAASGRTGAFTSTLEEFSRYWERIDVLTPAAPAAGQRVLFGNVHFWPAAPPRLLQPAFIVHHGRQLAAQRKYALIISHDYGFFLNGIGAARLSAASGVPYLSEIHHVEGFPQAASSGERVRRIAAGVYLRWARNRARAFRVVNSQELPALLHTYGIAAHKVLVLHSLYLDFDVLQPTPASKRCDVLFVARMTPNKGGLLLLDALAQVLRVRGSLRVAVVGDGSLLPAMQRRAAQLGLEGCVDWLGWQGSSTALAELYRSARCLVCASRSEGGPRVVAEALACGTPVVSTAVGMARELVRNGENGFLAGWSAAELATRIIELLSDEALQARMAVAAPAAVARFEKQRVIGEFARACQQLAVAPPAA